MINKERGGHDKVKVGARTTHTKKRRSAYYYAGGKKVQLRRASPNDPACAAVAKLPRGNRVYRVGDTILMVTPEVRVEESRPQHRRKLEMWLNKHKASVEVVSRDDERLVLRPLSRLGSDALAIANTLHEQIGTEMAQAHFIRITGKPMT